MIQDWVAWLYQSLGQRGLIVGRPGNVSARAPEGIVITPAGAEPETMAPGDLATATMNGTPLDAATPSSEWALHAAVYRTCPDAAFVAHTHSDACTALACLDRGLPPFHHMVLQFGGNDVRCAAYATFGSAKLAEHTAAAINGRSACLLANHGMIVCGTTPRETLSRAIQLERLCRQFLMALSAGTPRLLTDRELLAAKERFKTYAVRPDR